MRFLRTVGAARGRMCLRIPAISWRSRPWPTGLIDVAGGAGDLGEGRSAIGDDLVGYLIQRVDQPEVGSLARAVISLGHALNTTLGLQLLDLAEVVARFGRVHAECLAALTVENGEHRDITWSIGDVDHVADGDSALLLRHQGVDVDTRVAVDAFVDLEHGASLRCVVDHVTEHAYRMGPVDRKSTRLNS